MADKYPWISPYAYCVWNPIKLIDFDGNEAGVPPSWVRTSWFALKHPNIASAIGPCIEGRMNTNNSTRSSRFATRGSSQSDQQTFFKGNGCEDDVDPCSERGAFRHALCQATITSYYGSDIATEVGKEAIFLIQKKSDKLYVLSHVEDYGDCKSWAMERCISD